MHWTFPVTSQQCFGFCKNDYIAVMLSEFKAFDDDDK